MQQPSNARKPSFLRQVLREAPVLVPAGIIFAVVQGGSLQDWLIALAAIVVVGAGLGWLVYQREHEAKADAAEAGGEAAKAEALRYRLALLIGI